MEPLPHPAASLGSQQGGEGPDPWPFMHLIGPVSTSTRRATMRLSDAFTNHLGRHSLPLFSPIRIPQVPTAINRPPMIQEPMNPGVYLYRRGCGLFAVPSHPWACSIHFLTGFPAYYWAWGRQRHGEARIRPPAPLNTQPHCSRLARRPCSHVEASWPLLL